MRDEPTRHTQGVIRRRGSRWQVDTTVGGHRVRRAAPSFEAAEQILEELGNRKKGRNGSSVATPASGVTVAENLALRQQVVSRPHQSLDGNAPRPREIEPSSRGQIVAEPQVGGLHHRYPRAA